MAWTDRQFNSYEEDSWQTRTTNPNPFIWYFLQGQKVAKFCEKFSITVRNTKLLILWDRTQERRSRWRMIYRTREKLHCSKALRQIAKRVPQDARRDWDDLHFMEQLTAQGNQNFDSHYEHGYSQLPYDFLLQPCGTWRYEMSPGHLIRILSLTEE